MKRENGRVIIDLSGDEFDMLLMALGYAAGAAAREGSVWMNTWFRIANAVNRDNPNWIPYEVNEAGRPV